MKKSAGVIVKSGNKCLLCKRSNVETYSGEWSIPGGKVEPDEEIIDNRDLMETKPTKAYVDGHDNESSGDSSDSDDSEAGAKFVNPLLQ